MVRASDAGRPAWATAGASSASAEKAAESSFFIVESRSTALRLAARMAAAPMDNVVKLEKPTKGKNTPRGQQARPRRRRSRTALVLGGGGFTGGVYEIGALRALDLLAVNKTV